MLYEPLDDLSTSIGVQFGVLAVTQIDHELLFGSRVETEIRLVGEVVAVEHNFDERSFRHERLRLFALATKDTRLFSIGNVRFRVAVHYLQFNKRTY